MKRESKEVESTDGLLYGTLDQITTVDPAPCGAIYGPNSCRMGSTDCILSALGEPPAPKKTHEERTEA